MAKTAVRNYPSYECSICHNWYDSHLDMAFINFNCTSLYQKSVDVCRECRDVRGWKPIVDLTYYGMQINEGVIPC